MLVLTRRRDQQIIVGDDIVITLVDIRGSQARIGVSAPAGIRIDRLEVRDRIDRERRDGEGGGR